MIKEVRRVGGFSCALRICARFSPAACWKMRSDWKKESRIKDQDQSLALQIRIRIFACEHLDSIIELLWVKLVNLHQLLDENTEVWGRWR